MDIRFSKDYKHNYLIIKDDRVIEGDYQLKMMTKNKVEGLIACQERMINGEGLLYYEITSRQSLKVLYDNRPIGIGELRKLFIRLKGTLTELNKYLLPESGLVLEPSYIYADMISGESIFLYYPYVNEDESSIIKLLEYLTEKIDSNDMEAVEAVYQMMDVLMRQHLSMFEALSWFEDEFGEDIDEDEFIEEQKVTHTSENEAEYFDEFDVYPIAEEKVTFFQRIKKLFIKPNYYEETYVEPENIVVPKSIDRSEEGTVYIPWIENTEQKLYGMGKHNKYHIDLNRTPVIVGKLKERVDMLIQDDSISRMHAKFLKQGSKYMMQDLNSTNGCYRNGKRLEPNEIVVIEPGDEIGLGKLKFIYR